MPCADQQEDESRNSHEQTDRRQGDGPVPTGDQGVHQREADGISVQHGQGGIDAVDGVNGVVFPGRIPNGQEPGTLVLSIYGVPVIVGLQLLIMISGRLIGFLERSISLMDHLLFPVYGTVQRPIHIPYSH